MLEQSGNFGGSSSELEIGLAVERMVMRVVSRELATTIEMPVYAAEVARRDQQGEFELSYSLWQAVDGFVTSELSVTQEMPAYLQDDLCLVAGVVRS
jgi:hypothetical protein